MYVCICACVLPLLRAARYVKTQLFALHTATIVCSNEARAFGQERAGERVRKSELGARERGREKREREEERERRGEGARESGRDRER